MAKENRRSNEVELLSKYIARIEKALEKVKHKRVILSTDLPQHRLGHGDVRRLPILWPLYEHSMFYITTLAVGTRVPRHRHNENVFRYVIEGSIEVDAGERAYYVSKGMWIVVRANTSYSLKTASNPHGAIILSAYQNQCKVT